MQNKFPFSNFKLSSVSGLQFFQLLRFGGLILLSILLVKTGKSKEDIAQYESLLWSVGFVSFFWINSLVQLLLAKFHLWNNQERKQELFKLYLVFQLFSLFSALFVALFFHQYLAALFLFFQGPANMNEYILYLEEKKRSLYSYATLSFSSFVLFSGLFVLLKFPIEIILYTIVFSGFLRWLYTLLLLHRYATFCFKLPSYSFFTSFAYLAIGFLFSGSGEFVNGWLVKHYFNEASFAEFRIGSKELPIFSILTATLSNSFISKISLNPSEEIKTLKAQSLKYMHLLFPMAILLVAFSSFLFPLIFSKAYQSSSSLFSLLLLLTIPRLVFPQTLLHAFQMQQKLMFVSIIEFFVSVTLSVVFIPTLGLMGIVIGFVVANMIEKLILINLLKWEKDISLAEYTPIGWFLTYSLALILAEVFIFIH